MGSIRSESWFLNLLNSGSPSRPESEFLILPGNLSDTSLDTELVGNINGDQHIHYWNQGHRDSVILVESFTFAVIDQPPSFISSCTTSPSDMGNLLPSIMVTNLGNHEFESGRVQFQFRYFFFVNQFRYHAEGILKSSQTVLLDNLDLHL
ncbi:hypothetical protein LINPERHAP1_LOCUS13254 [Linum perenne]